MNYRAYQWIKYRRIMNVGRFKTKRGLAASLFVLGVVNIFLADLAESQERKKIVAAYVAASEQMIVPTLAQETGIFRKQGLDAQIVLVSGSPRNVQSLIAGNFDYTMAGVTPLVRARLSGADPVILGAIANYSRQRILVAPQMRIHKLEELRGKIVGVTQYGSEGDTFLRIALKSAGLRPDIDVTIFQTGGGANTVQALAAGKNPSRGDRRRQRVAGQAVRCRGGRFGRRNENPGTRRDGGDDSAPYRARPPRGAEFYARLRRSDSFF